MLQSNDHTIDKLIAIRNYLTAHGFRFSGIELLMNVEGMVFLEGQIDYDNYGAIRHAGYYTYSTTNTENGVRCRIMPLESNPV